jgi:anti-anti-sigma factor
MRSRRGFRCPGGDPAELDLSAVTFMDSTGIRLMILMRSSVHAAGHNLRIIASSPAVYGVLEITGLLDLLDVPSPADDQRAQL